MIPSTHILITICCGTEGRKRMGLSEHFSKVTLAVRSCNLVIPEPLLKCVFCGALPFFGINCIFLRKKNKILFFIFFPLTEGNETNIDYFCLNYRYLLRHALESYGLRWIVDLFWHTFTFPFSGRSISERRGVCIPVISWRRKKSYVLGMMNCALC